jgi:Flp pilus assembly protein TadG
VTANGRSGGRTLASCAPARRRERRGAVLVLAVLWMAALGVFAALALDVGMVHEGRRRLQAAADAAARAGAMELGRGRTVAEAEASARAVAAMHGFTHGGDLMLAVSTPPTQGEFVGDANFVEVRIERSRGALLAGLANVSDWTLRARAVAGGAAGRTCLYLLGTTGNVLNIPSPGVLTMTGCGVAANTRDAVTVTSARFQGTGAFIGTSASQSPPSGMTTFFNQAPPEQNPLASVVPTIASGCNFSNEVKPLRDTTLNPGRFCGGMLLGGTRTYTLNPGVYVFKEKGLKVEGSARVNGTGVTIVVTRKDGGSNSGDAPGKIEIVGFSTINLSAPTSGATKGIVFMKHLGKNDDPVLISTERGFTINGSLYFPDQMIRFDKTATSTVINGAVVARALELLGGRQLTINVPPPSFSVLRSAVLVE